jgi:RNA polymerase sigma-70 factor (ECF subfamily)
VQSARTLPLKFLTVSAALPGAPAEEERRLVEASLAGDTEAFSDLVRLHQHRVFRLAGRFFRRRADVEDAAQETFLRAWRKLASYERRAPFEHWLTRVCLNCCYALLKRAGSPPEPLEDRAGTIAIARDADVPIEVERALRTLDPRDRFILLLLDGEGWGAAEIAAKLGWSRANVKVRAFRARRRLRRLLEGS